MIDYPKLGTPVILGIAGAFCLYAAWVEVWPREAGAFLTLLRALLFITGLWLLAMALIAGVNVVAYQAGQRVADLNWARTFSERVRLAETVSRMSPEQLKFVGQASGATLEFIVGIDSAGQAEALPMEIRTQWGNIPVKFIRIFIDRSTDGYTPPIRIWGEGTRERDHAQALVALFTSYGWVSPAVGNNSARWLNREAAEQLLGRMGIT